MRATAVTALALLLVAPTSACARSGPGAIHATVPDTPDPATRYLVYLHGAIIETQGRRPTHPRLGTYEYDAILEALAAEGFQVISEARSAGTEAPVYADKVAAQVRELVAAGVPPGHIAVAGHSKGGLITIGASSLLDLPDLRYVILAGCFAGASRIRDTPLSGRILSIYDTSDRMAGSCQPLFDQASERETGPAITEEITIDTGLGHGAFYEPRDVWVKPMVRWLRGEAKVG